MEPRAADVSTLHGGNLYAGAAGVGGASERNSSISGAPGNGHGHHLHHHHSLGSANPLPSYLDLADGAESEANGGRRRFQRNMSVPMSPSMSHRWLEVSTRTAVLPCYAFSGRRLLCIHIV